MTRVVPLHKAASESIMRIWLPTVLFLLSAAWVSTAQPPTAPPEASKLVIRPGGKGAVPVKEPGDKAGFIIIRPGGKGSTTTQIAEPKRPATGQVADLPAGALKLPPPGPQPKLANGDKPIFDYWFAVGVDGQRVGYVNWAARETKQKDKVLAIGVRYLKLTIQRFGQPVALVGEESTVETLAGQVLVTSMRQQLGKDQSLALTGVVNGKVLKITGDGAAAGAQDTPWPEGVIGIVRELRLYKERNLKPGESFEYLSYIPTFNRAVKTTLTLEGEESRVLWANTPARKLLRFVTKPEPIGKVKLPSSTTWVDTETFEPLQMEADFPTLGGRLSFVRTTKEAATIPITRPVELFKAQSIRLDREILGIHGRGSVVYKVTVDRDDDPASLFATDTRQLVKNLDPKAKTFELVVTARHGPDKTGADEPVPGKEFTSSNFFLNWDNDPVKALAAKAIDRLPATASDWDKAVAIEKWVHANMKAFEFSQAMATADNVARTLSGDCTEYAMLSAAMCRAVGVPSRTALGVVYAPAKDGLPYLAYHMWFEVYAGKQWVPLDATLGMAGVGPGHLKISDHSWHDEKSFAPLWPTLRVLTAKPSITVLKVGP